MTTLYNVVKADTPEQLEVQVMEYLEKGWKPQGGMQVVSERVHTGWSNIDGSPVYTDYLRFFQAVIAICDNEIGFGHQT